MEKQIKIKDESGDDKMLWETIGKPAYEKGLLEGRQEAGLYAVIPMSILENKVLSANAKLLYGEIMALSKKSGKCYATNEYLSDIIGLSKSSIPQILRELAGIGLILVDIQRSKKGTYRNITVSFFNNGGYMSTTMRGIAKEQGQKRNRQIEIDKIYIAEASSAPSIFSLKDEIKKLEDSPRRDLNIIAFYLEQRTPDIKTAAQLQVLIRRHLRAAKELKVFTDDQIVVAAKKAKVGYKDIDWTLETLKKILTK